jgi:hypothetical protein
MFPSMAQVRDMLQKIHDRNMPAALIIDFCFVQSVDFTGANVCHQSSAICLGLIGCFVTVAGVGAHCCGFHTAGDQGVWVEHHSQRARGIVGALD